MIIRRVSAVCILVVALCVASIGAQVGKSQGIVDVNTIAEADLAKLPHMTPAIAKAVVANVRSQASSS